MQALLFGMFDWFAKNKTAQAIAFGVAIVLGIRTYGAWEAHKARRDEQRKQELQAKELEGRVKDQIHNIERTARDQADQAITARDTAPRGVPASELPKPVQDRIFRD